MYQLEIKYIQKVVAKRAGYTEQQFSNILCGRKNIETDDILRIAKALSATPNELYGIIESS